MAISKQEREQRYQRLFDGFVHTRELDIEYDNWSAEDESAWAEEVAKFNTAFPE